MLTCGLEMWAVLLKLDSRFAHKVFDQQASVAPSVSDRLKPLVSDEAKAC